MIRTGADFLTRPLRRVDGRSTSGTVIGAIEECSALRVQAGAFRWENALHSKTLRFGKGFRVAFAA